MRTKHATAVAFVIALAAYDARADQCTPLFHQGAPQFSCISIVNAGYPDDGSLSNAADAAVSFWNTGCNGTAVSGVNYPSFAYGGCSAADSMTVSVIYHNGPSTNSIGSCADFVVQLNASQQIIGGAIELWQEDYRGQSCSTDLTWFLEHEMGHVLGMDDAPAASKVVGGACFGRIMGNHYVGQNTPLQNADCTTIDSQWNTPEENPCFEGGCTAGYRSPDQFGCQYGDLVDECGCCMHYSPIIIDIGGHGIQMSSLEEGVVFDLNGYGDLRRMAWPVGPDNAWLAFDRNHNGRIDGGWELFGNTTRLTTGAFAQNGYEALAEFDENHDGMFDKSDPRFADLVIWRDLNRNGVSEPGELVPLANAGIEAISLDVRHSARRDRWGNQFTLRSKVIFTTPPSRFSYDVFPVVGPPTTR